MVNGLLKTDLFHDLPETEHQDLLQHCSVLEFDKREIIFREGEEAEAIWFILSGWVRLVKHSPEGRSVTVIVMTPKEPICGVSALGYGMYTATAVAASHVQVAKVPRATFTGLLERYPFFSKKVIEICCKRIREMAFAYAIAYDPVDLRLAHILLRLSEDFGTTLPFTHKEISEMGGMALETSIRVLSKMKQKGWLKVRRGEISLLRPWELRKVVHHAH